MVDVATLALEARTDGLIKAEAALDQVTRAAVRTEAAADGVTSASIRQSAALGTMKASAQGTAGGFQNLGFQIQDFAVQVGAGTSATQALGQQLPQLLSGFGLLGIALGTTAAIAIPIAGYFFNMGDEAETATDKVDRLTDSVSRLQEINANFDVSGIDKLIEKYGELDAAIVLLMNRQRELAENEAMAAARDAGSGFAPAFEGALEYLSQYEEGLERIAASTGIDQAAAQMEALAIANEAVTEEFGLTIDQIKQMKSALDAMANANTVGEMADATAILSGLLEGSSLSSSELENELLRSEDALRQLNAQGNGVNSWLDAAIDWAGSLGAKLWDAAAAASAVRGAGVNSGGGVAGGRGAGKQGPDIDPFGFRSQLKRDERSRGVTSSSTKAATGGGVDGFQSRLDALVEGLQTERETVDNWYSESMEILNDRRARELLGAQGHADALLMIEEELHRRKTELRDQDLGHYESFFGSMAGALQSGGERMLAISKGFALAEAAVSMWRGAAKALELPFPASLAAWGQVLATGARAISGIRSASFGGGGGMGGVGSSPSAPPVSQSRSLRVVVEGDTIFANALRGSVRQIAEALGEERNIGGFVVA